MENEKRLIDANTLLKEIERIKRAEKKITSFTVHNVIACIKIAPIVDAVEVVHGKWVSSGCGFDCCSECRKVYADGYLTAMGIKPRTQFKYCPNCGAKMDGDGNG